MTDIIAARLDQVLRAAGLEIEGVSIGDTADKSTWKVHPATFQLRAQLYIDQFNKDDSTFVRIESDSEVAANHILQIELKALLKNLPAMFDEITRTGGLRDGLWLKRIEAMSMTLARARRNV